MSRNAVKRHYAEFGIKEWRRTVKNPYHRLERDTTLHFLTRYLPPTGRVLDAGGGPGRYTIVLAQKGYDIVLLDVTPRLLAIAKRQIARAGVSHGEEEHGREEDRGMAAQVNRHRTYLGRRTKCLYSPRRTIVASSTASSG